MSSPIDFYGSKLNSYRACLHTHSTGSDGLFTPQQVLDYYAGEGYDIVCITDHFHVTPTEGLDTHGMLVIPSAELHPNGGRIHQSHFVCIGIPADMTMDSIPGCNAKDGSGMQALIDAVNAVGGVCIAAHPNWCGFRSEEIACLHGLAAMEIYNHDCSGICRGYSDELFNELCDRGIRLPVTAVDDTHVETDFFGGSTYICCEALTRDSVMKALKSGSFYASQGPEFTRLNFEKGIFDAEFTRCRKAVLQTNRCRAATAGIISQPGRLVKNTTTSLHVDTNPWRFDPTGTDIAHHIQWQFQCNYVSCTIEDEMGRKAWTAPLYLPALSESYTQP